MVLSIEPFSPPPQFLGALLNPPPPLENPPPLTRGDPGDRGAEIKGAAVVLSVCITTPYSSSSWIPQS